MKDTTSTTAGFHGGTALARIAQHLVATGRPADTLRIFERTLDGTEAHTVTITAQGRLLVDGRDETEHASAWISAVVEAKRAGHAHRVGETPTLSAELDARLDAVRERIADDLAEAEAPAAADAALERALSDRLATVDRRSVVARSRHLTVADWAYILAEFKAGSTRCSGVTYPRPFTRPEVAFLLERLGPATAVSRLA